MDKSAKDNSDIIDRTQKWSRLGTRQSVILDFSNKKNEGEVYIQNLSKNTRTVRALKRFAICWGAAIAAVFLPILHFILVPGLLIAGPLLGFWIYNQKSLILGGKGTCPQCKKELVIEQIKEKWPLIETCPHCRTDVKITRTEDNEALNSRNQLTTKEIKRL